MNNETKGTNMNNETINTTTNAKRLNRADNEANIATTKFLRDAWNTMPWFIHDGIMAMLDNSQTDEAMDLDEMRLMVEELIDSQRTWTKEPRVIAQQFLDKINAFDPPPSARDQMRVALWSMVPADIDAAKAGEWVSRMMAEHFPAFQKHANLLIPRS